MISVVLHGGGRMAQAISQAVEPASGIEIRGIVSLEPPAWETALPCFSSLEQLPWIPDLLIDFSLPEGTLTAAQWCEQNKVALLSGVTGLADAEKGALARAARSAPVLWSPNMSVGVNLLAGFCAQAAAALGPAATVHIEDIHHQWKKDAPSGTALMLGAAVSGARHPSASKVTYSDVREGEHVGEHHVIFEWAGEKMVLSHQALDRAIFARGALRAADWLAGQKPGLYTAADWLAI